MKTIKLIILINLCFSILTINAATVKVDGYVFLEKQSKYDSIMVVFERIAPSSLTYTTFTNDTGYYIQNIQTGIYKITYLKSGYFSSVLLNQLLYSDTTILIKTLKPKGTYSYVPTDISTIQTAIDYANANDTIIVEPGTYFENINFHGKNIILASRFILTEDTSFISSTIVDGNNNGHAVVFNSGENLNCQLIGLSIIHGQATATPSGGDYNSTCGGGIYCVNSSPTLKSLIIRNNSTITTTNNSEGAGIYLYGSSPSISNSIIKDNTASSGAVSGGISMTENSKPIIDHCIVEHNSNIGINNDANNSSIIRNTIIKNNISHGLRYANSSGLIENCIITGNGQSGIYNYGHGNLKVINTNFFDNTPCQFGGSAIFTGASDSLIISNCIFASNNGSSAILNYSSFPTNYVTIQYSDFYNNSDGNFSNCSNYLGTIVTSNSNGTSCDAFYNIFEDPKVNSDLSLQSQSPCIDAGINDYVALQYDIANNQRIFDGNGDSIAIVDIGAHEFLPLKITYTKQDVTIYGGHDGFIYLAVTGGKLPYHYLWNTSDTTQNLDSLETGNYSVTVTDNLGDTASANIIIGLLPLPLKITYTKQNVSTFGGHDGFIHLLVTGGQLPYHYLWNTSDTTQNLDSLISGNYSVTVFDNLGDTVTAQIIIGSPPLPLKITYAKQDISTQGGHDGFIHLTVTGGQLPYHYLWNTSDTTQNLDSLKSGNYSVTVTDKFEDTATAHIIIGSPPLPLKVTYTKQEITTRGGHDGFIHLTVTGGQLPYHYLWSTGDTIQNLDSLKAGTYRVTVTDNLGDTASAQILIEPSTGIAYSISGNVYAGAGRLSGGVVLLFKQSSNNNVPVKYSLVSNGLYSFNSIDSGSYIIYVIPDSIYACRYLPTYYVSESSWQNAYKLNVDGKLYGVDIQMIPFAVPILGTGVIRGYVSYIDSTVYEFDIYRKINFSQMSNSAKNDDTIINPAKNIAISICNESGEQIAWTLSDVHGYYEFNGLPYGKYKILVEKPGYFLSKIPIIGLNQENDTVDKVMVLIEKGYITVNIKDNKFTSVQVAKIYPNPVMSYLQIELNPGKSGNINIKLCDIQGHTFFNANTSVIPSTLQEIVIPLNKLQPGFYYGRITSGIFTTSFKFYKH